MSLIDDHRDFARLVERLEGQNVTVIDGDLVDDQDGRPVALLEVVVPERAATDTPAASMYPAEAAEPPPATNGEDDEVQEGDVDDVDQEDVEEDSDDRDVAPDVEEEIVDAVKDVTDDTGEDDATESPDTDDISLTDLQQEVVDALAEWGEQSAGDLKTATGHGDSIYERLRALSDQGIVDERDDPGDGRRTLYSLSDRGAALTTADDGLHEGAGGADDGAPDRVWCGACGAGPFTAEGDVEAHHDREGHAGEPVVTDADPAELVGEGDPPRGDSGVAVEDGGAVATADTGAAATCQNCGSQVTGDFARVFTPDDESNPRVCPHCEDKIRTHDNDVRTRRDKGQHLQESDSE